MSTHPAKGGERHGGNLRRYSRPKPINRAARLPAHVDALMMASAAHHGRSISTEIKLSIEAWGLISALQAATVAGDAHARRQISDDLRGLLREALDAEPVTVSE